VVELELRDESWVGIRPIRPEDKHALLAGFMRLSDASRYKRFLTSMETLSPSQLTYLTEVDHHDHEALIAYELATRDAVGVGRFVRLGDGDGDEAEAAVTVADDWQGRGLGTALTRILAGRAVEEGITSFVALLLAGNAEMVGLLRGVGELDVTAREGETIAVRVPLAPEVIQDPALRGVLRAVASTGGGLAKPPGGG
jgi:GNAT superfamily N-acetyltransferase